MAMFGLMAYSAFANFLGVLVTLGNSPADAGLGLVLGSLYSFGAYRVWSKDDTRWWPVAIPACISIAVLLLAWLGGFHRPMPILLNVVLLVLVPIRRRAAAALPDGSLKRSEEHTSELQSLMRLPYSVFCLKKKNT